MYTALMLFNKKKMIVCESVRMVSVHLPISWSFSHKNVVFIVTGLQDLLQEVLLRVICVNVDTLCSSTCLANENKFVGLSKTSMKNL